MQDTPIEALCVPETAPAEAGTRIHHVIRVCRSAADFARLRPAWDALAASCPPGLDFTYCEVAAARAFALGATVSVALVNDGAVLVALCPVMIVRRGAYRVARALGCGNDQEYAGPIVADPGDVGLYSAALEALSGVGADVLEMVFVERDSPLATALAHVPQSWVTRAIPERWRRVDSYSIGLSAFPSYDAFIATRPESLRGSLRRRARRLADHGAVQYGWCQDADDAHEVLTWLFANKRRWAIARGFGTAFLMDDRVRDFFIDVAGRIDLVATPLVFFVKLNGKPVAASVNLVGPRCIEYFITTYDESYAAFSVGNLLVDSIVRWAHESRRDVDFRPFFSTYKERWASRKSWYESHFVILTLRGRLVELPLAAQQLRRVVRKLIALADDRLFGLGTMLRARRGTSKSDEGRGTACRTHW
ncbi:GNAT family N-acetyltransferase [Paraburkholderia mimosarum]|uniref:GNAT family N-acetyltransferase n=1 Tax=Paraburkholderia mimosarum TaxID=312026 RepID=UPI0004258CC3|nr:GNAT family N-acetyltransferase [Paraburkholderia mimosarum]